jgi:hypothetical protein
MEELLGNGSSENPNLLCREGSRPYLPALRVEKGKSPLTGAFAPETGLVGKKDFMRA